MKVFTVASLGFAWLTGTLRFWFLGALLTAGACYALLLWCADRQHVHYSWTNYRWEHDPEPSMKRDPSTTAALPTTQAPPGGSPGVSGVTAPRVQRPPAVPPKVRTAPQKAPPPLGKKVTTIEEARKWSACSGPVCYQNLPGGTLPYGSTYDVTEKWRTAREIPGRTP